MLITSNSIVHRWSPTKGWNVTIVNARNVSDMFWQLRGGSIPKWYTVINPYRTSHHFVLQWCERLAHLLLQGTMPSEGQFSLSGIIDNPCKQPQNAIAQAENYHCHKSLYRAHAAAMLLIAFCVHVSPPRNPCPFTHVVPHKVRIAYPFSFKTGYRMLQHASWESNHRTRTVLQIDPKTWQLKFAILVAPQCRQQIVPMKPWISIPVQWRGTVGNDWDAVKNRCPLIENILRLDFRNLS